MGIVHCRVCGGNIDRENDADGTWFSPAKNYFYHVKCYDTWKKKKDDIHSEANEKLWKDAVYEYLKRDMKIVVDFQKFNSQWNSLIKKNRTPKGIYFTVRYFYEIQKGDKDKAQGGIGIVEYIYEEACAYWCEKENRESGILDKIEEQIKSEKSRTTRIVHQPKKKKKIAPTFEEIEMMEGVDDC